MICQAAVICSTHLLFDRHFTKLVYNVMSQVAATDGRCLVTAGEMQPGGAVALSSAGCDSHWRATVNLPHPLRGVWCFNVLLNTQLVNTQYSHFCKCLLNTHTHHWQWLGCGQPGGMWSRPVASVGTAGNVLVAHVTGTPSSMQLTVCCTKARGRAGFPADS